MKRIVSQIETMNFEKLFDAFNRVIQQDAKERVQNSAKRYIAALENNLFET